MRVFIWYFVLKVQIKMKCFLHQNEQNFRVKNIQNFFNLNIYFIILFL